MLNLDDHLIQLKTNCWHEKIIILHFPIAFS